MFLVPIVETIKEQKPNYTLYQFWILLERNGTHLMEVASATAATEFAAENNLEVMTSHEVADCIFLKIRPTPALADFYTWDEVAPGTLPMRELWRPFLWTGPTDALGIHKPLFEIPLSAEAHSVGSILTSWTSWTGLRP